MKRSRAKAVVDVDPCYLGDEVWAQADPDPDYPPITVCSYDIGTRNFAGGRFTLVVAPGSEGQTWWVWTDGVSVIDIRGGDGMIDHVVEALFAKLASPEYTWLWKEPHAVTGDPLLRIAAERQVDQIQSVADKEDEEGGGQKKYKKRKYKPPIMYAVYAALKMLVEARASPAAILDTRAWYRLQLGSANVPIESITPSLVFIPRSGSQKAGLRGLHGSDRKEGAGDTAMTLMEDDGDQEAAQFLYSLPAPLPYGKPRQDAADVYLQARHLLEELHDRRLKDARKRKLEEDRAERQTLKATRKRKREEDRAEKQARKRPRKKTRVDDTEK